MAIDSNQKPRRLPYPLQHPEAQGIPQPETTPEPITFEWETADSDEIVSIRLELSLNEYTALAACVDVGRDVAFNQDADWMWQIWTKAFRGAIMVDCADIANCIETDTDVQVALDENTATYNDRTGALNPDYLSPSATENTTIINNRFPPTERDVPAHTLADCNLDELWGGIYFMVQQLDNTGRDWLEQAVASGDKWQRAASIAKNIPIIGSLASTALEQLAEVAQDLLNLYNAYSTEAELQDIACALFELACAECRYPTFQEIADYYAQNSTITGGNLTEISLKAMVDFLIGSSLAISQLAYHTIISMVLFTLYIGSEFVGLRGARWISIWLDNGEEFANDAWQVLCDGCGETPVILAIGYPANGACAAQASRGTIEQVGFNQYRVQSDLGASDNAFTVYRVGSNIQWTITALVQEGANARFQIRCRAGVEGSIQFGNLGTGDTATALGVSNFNTDPAMSFVMTVAEV